MTIIPNTEYVSYIAEISHKVPQTKNACRTFVTEKSFV